MYLILVFLKKLIVIDSEIIFEETNSSLISSYSSRRIIETPNIKIGNLEISKQEDTNTIIVSLTYSVINTNINDTLEIDFT